MSEETNAPGGPMRIVLELTSEAGTVCGTFTTAEGSRSFWGWLELMSALELAAGATPEPGIAGEAIRPGADAPTGRRGSRSA